MLAGTHTSAIALIVVVISGAIRSKLFCLACFLHSSPRFFSLLAMVLGAGTSFYGILAVACLCQHRCRYSFERNPKHTNTVARFGENAKKKEGDIKRKRLMKHLRGQYTTLGCLYFFLKQLNHLIAACGCDRVCKRKCYLLERFYILHRPSGEQHLSDRSRCARLGRFQLCSNGLSSAVYWCLHLCYTIHNKEFSPWPH